MFKMLLGLKLYISKINQRSELDICYDSSKERVLFGCIQVLMCFVNVLCDGQSDFLTNKS